MQLELKSETTFSLPQNKLNRPISFIFPYSSEIEPIVVRRQVQVQGEVSCKIYRTDESIPRYAEDL